MKTKIMKTRNQAIQKETKYELDNGLYGFGDFGGGAGCGLRHVCLVERTSVRWLRGPDSS
jgi:hypothetical protein